MWQHSLRKTLRENNQDAICRFMEVQYNRKIVRNDDSVVSKTSAKKPRVSWKSDLHQRFLNAVNQLGVDKAVPKQILKIMDVPGLTKQHVASHLQKYRLSLKGSPKDKKGGRRISKFNKCESLELPKTNVAFEAVDVPENDLVFQQESMVFGNDISNISSDMSDIFIDLNDLSSDIFLELDDLSSELFPNVSNFSLESEDMPPLESYFFNGC